MIPTIASCLICGLPFESRTSYGLCAFCIRKDTLREFDRWSSAVKRAERDRIPTGLTLVQWLGTVSDYRGLCAFCGEMSMHEIAMVDPLRGLVWENVVPACRSCMVHKRHGFESALQRVRQYLSANSSRTEEDIRLEYSGEEPDEVYVPDLAMG